jgi:integrase
MPSKEKRVRVERGLYKAGDVFYACATPPGSRSAMWRSLGAVGIMEARRRRQRFAADLQATAPAALGARATLADVAAEWLREQRVRLDVGEMSERTFEIYEVGLRRHVLPALGSRQVRAITPDELVAWIRRMRARYSPHTVHNYWGALHLVLGFAVRRGLIAGNPAASLTSSERPKPGASRRRFLSRHEIERLLDAVPERYLVAVTCALFSGLRLSELLGLTWGDIQFERGAIHVTHQLARDGSRRPLKTSAARREVVLMPELSAALRRHRLASLFSDDRDLVFCSDRGRTVGHRNLTARGLTKATERAGLDGVTFHVLRHTFASILIDQGHDIVFVSRQLGHANPSITLKVYAHLFDAERHADRARKQLDAEYGRLIARRG